ncbi:MAG: ABC transporter ATP-binding protein [Cytophagales bacterium]
MKTYFRLLEFASPLKSFAILYTLFSVLSIIFGMFTFALIIPLLDIIFNQVESVEKIVLPEARLDFKYLRELFEYFFHTQIKENGKKGALLFVCVVVISCNLLTNLFRYLSTVLIIKTKSRLMLKMRKDVYQKILNLHLGFFSNERKGELMARFFNDINAVEGGVVNTMQNILKDPLTVIAYLVLLFNISWELTLVSLIIFPISGFIISAIAKRLKRDSLESQMSFGRLYSMVDETIGGMRIIMSFTAQSLMQGKFDHENQHNNRVSRKMQYNRDLASPLSEVLGITVVASILWIGGNIVLEGNTSLTASAFIVYLTVFSQILSPAKSFSNTFSTITTSLVSGKRVLDLLDTPSKITENLLSKEIKMLEKGISFNNVSFKYLDDEVLKNIHLHIPKGKTVALVGQSGSGKSTMADLVPRFYDVTSGDLLIDDTNVKNIKIESLRNMIGIVSQESILFNDTIYNNILFGKPNATKEEVEQAAKIANAHEFIIKSEQGYQTNIGDRGIKLSGGQRQRLSIARAVLKNPPILILDEATSALDTESEKLVQDALNNLMKSRTSIVIAHRLSTIHAADLIVVLDKGQIVETGNHQELMNNKGIYYKLNQLQGVNE